MLTFPLPLGRVESGRTVFLPLPVCDAHDRFVKATARAPFSWSWTRRAALSGERPSYEPRRNASRGWPGGSRGERPELAKNNRHRCGRLRSRPRLYRQRRPWSGRREACRRARPCSSPPRSTVVVVGTVLAAAAGIIVRQGNEAALRRSPSSEPGRPLKRTLRAITNGITRQIAIAAIAAVDLNQVAAAQLRP
jgi:hypothetical protein